MVHAKHADHEINVIQTSRTVYKAEIKEDGISVRNKSIYNEVLSEQVVCVDCGITLIVGSDDIDYEI